MAQRAGNGAVRDRETQESLWNNGDWGGDSQGWTSQQLLEALSELEGWGDGFGGLDQTAPADLEKQGRE